MKIGKGTVINDLQVIDIVYQHTEKSSYINLKLKCLECGKEFEKSYNTFKLGKTKCTCKGGYRVIKK